MFPKGTSTSQVVDRMERLADVQGINIQIKSIVADALKVKRGEDEAEQLQSIAFSMELVGPVQRLLAYIDGVEHVQELSSIRSWAIAPGVKLSEQSVTPFVLTMTVVFYFQP